MKKLLKEKFLPSYYMKKLLKEKFLPSYYMQDNYSMFNHLEQGNSSVAEYARGFESYLTKCRVNEDEPQTLVRFLGGIDSHIARLVDLHTYTNEIAQKLAA